MRWLGGFTHREQPLVKRAQLKMRNPDDIMSKVNLADNAPEFTHSKSSTVYIFSCPLLATAGLPL
jgi:hypothetical protein